MNLSWRKLPTKGWGESKSCPIFENYLSSWGFRGLDRWCLELDMIAEYLVLSLRVLKRISLPSILTLQVIILSIQLSSPFHANQNPLLTATSAPNLTRSRISAGKMLKRERTGFGAIHCSKNNTTVQIRPAPTTTHRISTHQSKHTIPSPP